jgi:hypothetical protein
MSGKSPAQPSRTSSGSGAGGAANASLQSSAAAPRSPADECRSHVSLPGLDPFDETSTSLCHSQSNPLAKARSQDIPIGPGTHVAALIAVNTCRTPLASR